MENTTISVREIKPKDIDVFIGMDTDRRSIAMTLVSDNTGRLKSVMMDYHPEGVLAYRRRIRPEIGTSEDPLRNRGMGGCAAN